MKDAKANIVAKALELFNEKGIEYVGMRELAAALNTRIGNITYYFPTKDDLVYSIGEAYSRLNTETRDTNPVQDINSLLVIFGKLFRNQLRYRCMLLSFVHIMEHNAAVAQSYEHVRKQRSIANENALCLLVANGYLTADDRQVHTLAQTFNLVSRFWLSEAIISGHHRNRLESQVTYYLKLLANLMKPYATEKGLRDLQIFTEE